MDPDGRDKYPINYLIESVTCEPTRWGITAMHDLPFANSSTIPKNVSERRVQPATKYLHSCLSILIRRV